MAEKRDRRRISEETEAWSSLLLWPYWAAKCAMDASQWWLGSDGVSESGPQHDLPWTSPNRILLEIAELRVREFSRERQGTPALICTPYALHGALVADFAPRHSLVEALRNAGLGNLYLAEWRSASPATCKRSIDSHLSDLNVAVDDIGRPVDLIGLCQGGWLSLIYAARFPNKVRRLVLAGVPVDVSVRSALSRAAACTPPLAFEALVDGRSGLVKGEQIRRLWPRCPQVEVDLQRNLSWDVPSERQLHERFDRWNAATLDLPGTFYLEAVNWIFKENRLAAGAFVALGRAVQLSQVKMPVFLLAGANDEVVPAEQALATASLLGTRDGEVATALVPSSHLGLFMGRSTLDQAWPDIAGWLRRPDQ